MMCILLKITTPPPSQFQRLWTLSWSPSGGIYHIDANQVGNMKPNLKRIRWAEQLRVVNLYIYSGTTKITALLNFHSTTRTWNHWVYHEVTNLLPISRILASGAPTCWKAPLDLIVLDCTTDPPLYRSYWTNHVLTPESIMGILKYSDDV